MSPRILTRRVMTITKVGRAALASVFRTATANRTPARTCALLNRILAPTSSPIRAQVSVTTTAMSRAGAGEPSPRRPCAEVLMAERRSTRDATVIAAIGTIVYCALAVLLRGVIGFFPETLGCFAGAWISSYYLGTQGRHGFLRSLPIAIAIVFATLVAIDLAHVVGRLVRGTRTSWEPLMLFLWAVGVTSWWLVPATAGIIVALNRSEVRSAR